MDWCASGALMSPWDHDASQVKARNLGRLKYSAKEKEVSKLSENRGRTSHKSQVTNNNK